MRYQTEDFKKVAVQKFHSRGTRSVADIQNLHPNLGRELIKKVLFKMRDEKKISLIVKGRTSQWKAS